MTPVLFHLIGGFTVLLGIAHFFLPAIVSLRTVVVDSGTPLRIPGIRYIPSRRDLHGLVLVMNHAVSYALVTIGFLDITLPSGLDTALGRGVAVWIGVWWLIRAVAQLHIGRRPFDGFVIVAFGSFAVFHLWAAWA